MTNFKTLMLAGAVALAFAGLAKAAAPLPPGAYLAPPILPWDGFVSAGGGKLTIEGTGGSSVPRKGIRGSAAAMLSHDVGVQFDVLGNTASGATGPGGIGTIDAAAHIYMRNPGGRLIGAFGQYRDIGAGAASGTLLLGGAEFQTFVGPAFQTYVQVAARASASTVAAPRPRAGWPMARPAGSPHRTSGST